MFEISESIILKILKLGVFASLLWFFLIAPASLYPTHLGKVLFLQGLIEVLFFFYVLLIIKYPKYRPKFNILTISILVWIFTLFVSGILGVNFGVSFWSNLGRMTGIFFILHIFAFYLILLTVFTKENDWKNFWFANVGVGIILSAFAHYQKIDNTFLSSFGYVDRIAGLFGNTAFFATYLTFIIFVSLFLFLKYKNGIKIRIFSGVSFLVFLIALFFTGTRGSIIGVFAGLLLFLLLQAIFSKNNKFRIFLVAFFVLLIFSGLFLWSNRDSDFINKSSSLKRAVNIDLNDFYSMGTRKIFWHGAYEGFKDRPILGWGIENYNLIIDKYYDTKLSNYKIGESWVTKPHNVFLEHLSGGGLAGFVGFVAIFLAAFILIMKYFKRKESDNLIFFSVFLALLAAHLIQNLVFFDTYYTYYMLFSILAFVSFSAGLNIDFVSRAEANKNIGEGVILSVFLVMVFLIFMNISTYKSSVLANGFNSKFLNTPSFYRKDIIIEYLKQYFKGIFRMEGGAEANIKLLTLMNDELKKSVSDYPVNSFELTMQIQALYNIGVYDRKYLGDAIETAKKAIDLYPDRYYFYQLLGNMYVLKKDYAMALENYKKIVDINSDFGTGHWYIGAVLYSDGKKEDGLKELDIAYAKSYRPENIAEWDFWAQAYAESKKYWEAIYLYNEAKKLDPNNSKYYEKLAAIYKELGDKEMAKSMASRAAEIDPKLKNDAEKFISSFK